MKILVTGGSGFIGANLCGRLLRDGHTVVCLDNFYSSKKENVAEFEENPNFTLIEHDIVEPLPEELSGIDQVYHLACPASPPIYQKDHIYTLKVNFEGTLRVLEAVKKWGAKLLFTSTSEVYGNPLVHPQKEDYFGNVNPNGERSCYDEGKRAAESLCMNYWKADGLPVKIVRVFNTYGPKMDMNDGRAVSNFIVQALKGEEITIYGNGKQTRSFQYIDDLIDGMIAYMDLDEDFPGPINLGNPEEVSILELAQRVIEFLDGDAELLFKDLPQDDPIKRCPDISLAKEKLGFSPVISLEEGLKKTIEYFKEVV